jgi:serine/threonine protein kinase
MPSDDLTSDPLIENVPVHEGYKVLKDAVLYEKLGQGGMGAVYKGRHLRLDVDVAVKVMALPEGMSSSQADNYVKRFIREAKLSASIRHQNLIRVLDVDSQSGRHFLIMDYIDGESAGDRLKRKRTLTEIEAVEICLRAAEGLHEAHRKGIVHRDIKPDNILIDREGGVVVADLGLAKAFDAGDRDGSRSLGLSMSQQVMGTPFYMSPEQTRSAKDVGPPADVWSLGVTLYHLLTGTLPFRDSDLVNLMVRIRSEDAPDPSTARPDLSEGVCTVIRKTLSKEPDGRYAHCGECADALREHLDSIRSSSKSVLPDAEAGSTKLALVSVTAPPAKTLTIIARNALAITVPGPPTADARPPGSDTRIDQVVEKRLRVMELREAFAEKHGDEAAEDLKKVDLDIKVAAELEERDLAAALQRLLQAEERLNEITKSLERPERPERQEAEDQPDAETAAPASPEEAPPAETPDASSETDESSPVPSTGWGQVLLSSASAGAVAAMGVLTVGWYFVYGSHASFFAVLLVMGYVGAASAAIGAARSRAPWSGKLKRAAAGAAVGVVAMLLSRYLFRVLGYFQPFGALAAAGGCGIAGALWTRSRRRGPWLVLAGAPIGVMIAMLDTSRDAAYAIFFGPLLASAAVIAIGRLCSGPAGATAPDDAGESEDAARAAASGVPASALSARRLGVTAAVVVASFVIVALVRGAPSRARERSKAMMAGFERLAREGPALARERRSRLDRMSKELSILRSKVEDMRRVAETLKARLRRERRSSRRQRISKQLDSQSRDIRDGQHAISRLESEISRLRGQPSARIRVKMPSVVWFD